MEPSECPAKATAGDSSEKVDYGPRAPFVRALNAIFEEDEGAFKAAIAAAPGVLDDEEDTWSLVHFLWHSDWHEGRVAYLEAGGRLELRTRDMLTSMRAGAGLELCRVGGQTILHIMAQRGGANRMSDADFAALCTDHPGLHSLDMNGRLPSFYRERAALKGHARMAALRAELDAVKARVLGARRFLDLSDDGALAPTPVAFEADAHPGIRCFTVTSPIIDELREGIAALPAQAPNSMHRYGKIVTPALLPAMKQLAAALLPADTAGRVTRLHAFWIRYGAEVAQTNLALHRDDSTWTINLCLGASPDLRGSGVRFPAQGFLYEHAVGRGIVHAGALPHLVEDLEGGERENLIVWISCG